MRQEIILFEKALRRANLFWKLTGMQINYDDKLSKCSLLGLFRKRWFYLGNFIWLTSGTISVFAMMNVLSIQIILYMTPCITLACLGDVKSFYFLYYENTICDIIYALRKLQSINHSDEKEAVYNEFVKKHLPFLNAANKLFLATCYVGITLFCIGPLMITSWQYWSTKEIKLFLPYTIWYPFDEYSYEGWPLAYLHQFWSAWITVFFVYGPDCFFYTACAFIHNQFCCLRFDVQKIGTSTFKNMDSFNEQVCNLIHRHKELIRCVNMLNVVYGKSTLFNVVSSSFIICLAGLNIKAIENLILMAPFAAVMFLGSIQIFLFCYYGDMIMRASLEVSDAIFNSRWYELDASSMKYCLFILMRAQKPCKITAFGYSDINLKTFGRIISSAWSYFTLLNTMYSKHS